MEADILMASQDFMDIARGVFIKLLVLSEDDNGDFNRAQHRQLMRLLEQTAFALKKRAGRGD